MTSEIEIACSFLGLTLRPPVEGMSIDDLILPLKPKTWEEADQLEPTELLYRTTPVKVCHYMSCERFVQLLRSQRLVFTPQTQQDKDPADGGWPNANHEEATGLNKEYYEKFPMVRNFAMLAKESEIDRRLTYLHCWFEGAYESKTMWSEFAGDGTGVLLCATTSELVQALSPFSADYRFAIDQVKYVDEDVPLLEFVGGLAGRRKFPKFEHESEIRLMATRLPPVDLASLPTILKAPIRLQDCIRAVFLGPAMYKPRREVLKKWIRRVLPKANVLDSNFTGSFYSEGLNF